MSDPLNEILGYNTEVDQLLARARGLPDGDEKIMLIEEAVRLADLQHDVKVQYRAREELVEASLFGGSPEKTLVAYSWCLAQFDKNPGEFWEWRILWRYKWVVNVICHFPQITREQIYEMLDDMERRFREYGYGLRAVYRYRYRTERFWGNREEALRYYRRAEMERNDDLSDCAACETDERVSFHIYCGEDERALTLAEPLISGRQKCRSVPQRTFGRILLPLLRLGREREAWQYHKRGYSMLENESKGFLEYLADHIVFLALYGDLKGAARLVERHYHWSEVHSDIYDQFLFYRASWLMLDLALDACEEMSKLRLPRTFPLYKDGDRYETVRLREWFEARARALAERFDARAGNDYLQRELLNIPALKEVNAERRAELWEEGV